MKNEHIGNLLISISIIVGFVFLIFGISASIIAGKSILLTIQIILGLLIFLGIARLGSSIKKRKEKSYKNIPEVEIMKFENTFPEMKEIIKPIIEKEAPKTNEKKSIEKKDLKPEEKKVIKLLEKAAENELMQSELIKKMKVTKVKMTRILKKLEEKNLILKKKIGMNNIIVLK